MVANCRYKGRFAAQLKELTVSGATSDGQQTKTRVRASWNRRTVIRLCSLFDIDWRPPRWPQPWSRGQTRKLNTLPAKDGNRTAFDMAPPQRSGQSQDILDLDGRRACL
jgi:beta-xylosidase